jgi:hypothetical protein
MKPKSELILYQTEDNRTRIEVRLENETVWLTQAQMAELFQTTIPNVSMHIRNILAEGELQADSVVKEFLTTAADGKNYITKFHNLDVIIAEQNMVLHNLANRLELFEGIWLEPLKHLRTAETADVLVSNPPYVRADAIGGLPEGFRRHVPHLAINGGFDGMDGHRAIINDAARYIKPGGYLVLQTDSGQTDHIADYNQFAQRSIRYSPLFC